LVEGKPSVRAPLWMELLKVFGDRLCEVFGRVV
jgi:hypothetical protein